MRFGLPETVSGGGGGGGRWWSSAVATVGGRKQEGKEEEEDGERLWGDIFGFQAFKGFAERISVGRVSVFLVSLKSLVLYKKIYRYIYI